MTTLIEEIRNKPGGKENLYAAKIENSIYSLLLSAFNQSDKSFEEIAKELDEPVEKIEKIITDYSRKPLTFWDVSIILKNLGYSLQVQITTD